MNRTLGATLCLVLLAVFSTGATASSAEEDPWEGVNRKVFAFNDWTDSTVVRPVAVGYRKVVPREARRGLGNAFANLLEIRNVFNGLLQGNIRQAGNDTGRFLINSTFGLVGLFDVAQHVGLDSHGGEDFGQTLAVWGVGSGPYVMLPLLGPSTVRDTLALPVDWYTDPFTYVEPFEASVAWKAASLLDTRTRLLDLERHITGDRYTFIRDAYLQRREYLILNGELEDDFGAGFGDDEYGDYDDYDF